MVFRTLIAVAAVALFVSAALLRAADPPAETIIVLRSGEILRGVAVRQGDRLTITSGGTEIRIKAADADFVCRTLDEAYANKRATDITGRIEDHLNLGEWCLKQGLHGYAARELGEAMSMDPKHPRVAWLDRKLTQAQSPDPPLVATTAVQPANDSEQLDRLVRSLPKGSVEAFTNHVQPLLINSCSTAGCHGPQSKNKLTLTRLPHGKSANRRSTQRNLQAVMQFVDREKPLQSKLLTLAGEAHGGARAATFHDRESSKYRQLAEWVLQVSGNAAAGESTAESTSDKPTHHAPATIDVRGAKPLTSDAASLKQRTAVGSETNKPGDRGRKEKEVDAPLPTKDPFDPAAFNRKSLKPPPD